MEPETRTVKLTIHRAHDLIVGDLDARSSDPYVKIKAGMHLQNNKGPKWPTLGKTKTVKKVRADFASRFFGPSSTSLSFLLCETAESQPGLGGDF
jgi:hypothetical protein